MRRPAAALLGLAALLGGGVACTGDGGASGTPAAAKPGGSPAATSQRPATDCGDPAASFLPLSPLPQPGHPPAGSTMARIVQRGRLIVGTAGDKPLLASRDPRTGTLRGIDIDLSREVARALFGDPDKVEFRTITYAARVPALSGGEVDLVAHSMTMTCPRWEQVDFSTEYYRDGQRIMVRADSKAQEVEDLAGGRMCVATGTTTLDNLRRLAVPRLELVTVADAADCLVLFQDGEVDAVSSNEIILRGYTVQDGYARITGRDLSDEPRGLAFAKGHVDLVGFVNGVLERMRADGTLARLLRTYLTPVGLPDVAVPRATYGRQP